MAFVPLLSVVVRHAFYGAAAPPLRLALDDGGAFERAGGVVKSRGARLDLYRPEEMRAPARVTLPVWPTATSVADVTPTGGVPLLAVDATNAGATEIDVDAAVFADPAAPRGPRDPLIVLDLALPPDGGAAQVVATLPTVSTLWAYHVIGGGEALDVMERDGQIAFAAAGETRLPDGRTARTWRSDTPIPLRARQDFTVSLTRARDFGPEPLIARLPIPSRATSKPPAATAGAVLQSDIYVTL